MTTTRKSSIDPLTGIVGALSDLQYGEAGVLQVIFEPLRRPWAESILRSLTFPDGSPFFDGPYNFVQQAKAKVSRPLYGVVIRVAGRGTNEDRAWGIARRLSGALSVFNNPEGNELFPLDNEDYPYDEHEIDVLLRRSRRCGMILNSDELTTLVHLPSASLQAPKLRRQSRMTRQHQAWFWIIHYSSE